MYLYKNNLQKGFTLVELMVVISIIALLSSVVLAATTDLRKRAEVSKVAQGFLQLEKAIELYRTNTGAYPLISPRYPYGSPTYPYITLLNPNLYDELVSKNVLASGDLTKKPSFIGGSGNRAMWYHTPSDISSTYTSTILNCGSPDVNGSITHDYAIPIYSSEPLVGLKTLYWSTATIQDSIVSGSVTYYGYCISSND